MKQFEKENVKPFCLLKELNDLFTLLLVNKTYVRPINFKSSLPELYAKSKDQEDSIEFLNILLTALETDMKKVDPKNVNSIVNHKFTLSRT